MSAPNTMADKFVLLFSTDWFRPHWTLTGFVPRTGTAPAFQQETRDFVSSMMGDATSYWDLPFTDRRLSSTRDFLFDALDRYHAEESKLGLIRAMVAGTDLSEALTDVSMAFWNDYEATIDEIRRADLTATDWDRRVVAFFADLPWLLQGHALTVLGFGI